MEIYACGPYPRNQVNHRHSYHLIPLFDRFARHLPVEKWKTMPSKFPREHRAYNPVAKLREDVDAWLSKHAPPV